MSDFSTNFYRFIQHLRMIVTDPTGDLAATFQTYVTFHTLIEKYAYKLGEYGGCFVCGYSKLYYIN